MKLWKILMGLIIFYFCLTAFNSMIMLAKLISMGNLWIEIGFYILMLVLFISYIIVPILGYFSRPAVTDIENALIGDKKAIKRVYKYYSKNLPNESKESFNKINKENQSETTAWLINYIKEQTDTFDGIIRQFSIKLTATVMISPNPFIDGITILYGNSKMIYMLSKKVLVRYRLKELWDMYFSVMSIASVTGLIEEFDEALEEIFNEIAEEFSELIEQESGKSIGDSIPMLNILVKAAGPIIQGAGNYAFITYNGKRFKYTVLNLIEANKKTSEDIRKTARQDARRSRYKYIQDMIKKMGLDSKAKMKEQMDVAKKTTSKIVNGAKDVINKFSSK